MPGMRLKEGQEEVTGKHELEQRARQAARREEDGRRNAAVLAEEQKRQAALTAKTARLRALREARDAREREATKERGPPLVRLSKRTKR